MTGTVTRTGDFHRRAAGTVAGDLDAVARAADGEDWAAAAVLADRLRTAGEQLYTAVVADMVAAGVDWWRLADLLSMHPQAVYERFGQGLVCPAEQRPELAVLVTAGLVAEHDWDDEFGIDLEDLGAEHSLTADPTVVALRQASRLLDDDVWIAVRLPAEHGSAARAEDGKVVRQWATVVVDKQELTWLAEALQLNAAEDRPEDLAEDLDPLH
ncbi:hypothetical protein [Catellatospora sp. NPDC049609]|uniref:hypothetical protein n=1 Tax=Catellatospora sp. NPDC049609 TaxID=3155505 RepID=UPI0034206A8C